MKKLLLTLVLLLLSSSVFADNRQAIVAASGGAVIPAVAGKLIVIKGVGIFATSATSVQYALLNGDNYLLGDATTKLVTDLDGTDGPAQLILPFNNQGWFVTDTANEAVTMYLSASTKVLVVVIYSYKTAY